MIFQQFLVANHPCTFVLVLCVHSFRKWQFAAFHLQNGIGEELHGVQTGQNEFQISRHQTNCGTELQQWVQRNRVKSYRHRIEIINPTIG